MSRTKTVDTPPQELLEAGHRALAEARFDDAVAAFQALTEQLPTRGSLWHDLGLARLRSGDPRAAVEALERSLALASDASQTRLNLARARLALGDADAARAECEAVLAREAGHYGARVLLGHVCECAGDVEGAEESYRAAARREPNAAAAWCGLARIDRLHDPESLERFLEASDLPREEESALRYALGAAFDRRGEHDRSFAHFARANDLRRSHYDPDARDELVRRTIAATAATAATAAMPRRNAGGAAGGDPTDAPVFIVGMPRSGTSLVEEILAAHPAVHALGERTELGVLARDLAEITRRPLAFPEGVAELSPLEAVSLARRYLAAVGGLPAGKSRLTDKAPGNFLFLDLVARLFPNARVVHCLRDPRDVALSCFFQDFGDHGGVSFASDLEHLARHLEGYRRTMDHFRATSPLAIHEVRYEDLVAAPEPEMRRLVEFVGLDWDPACLRFHENRRAVVTASTRQVRAPIHTRSVARWRAHEAHLGPLVRLGPS